MTELKFDDKGLIPVVVQDYITNEVLMVAWANEEAVELMKETARRSNPSRPTATGTPSSSA